MTMTSVIRNAALMAQAAIAVGVKATPLGRHEGELRPQHRALAWHDSVAA